MSKKEQQDEKNLPEEQAGTEELKNGSAEAKNATPGRKQETASPATEKTAEEKLAELSDKYVRLYADFENFRKRASRERMELLKYASEETFRQILPVLDDFERGFKSMTDAGDVKTIREGQELIYNKLKNILLRSGLEEMKSVGEAFNPDLHEAVTNIAAPTEEQKGKVVEEVEKGYCLNGKVIRHAKVIVGN